MTEHLWRPWPLVTTMRGKPVSYGFGLACRLCRGDVWQ